MPKPLACPSCHREGPVGANFCFHCGKSLGATGSGQDDYDVERFFSFALDMLCIAGVDGFFKRVNPAFERVLGYSQDELLTTPFVELIHPDDRTETLRELGQLASGLPTLSFENRYRCRDGSYRHLFWTSFPDPVTGLLYAVARDITVRRRLEDELWQPLRVDMLTGICDRPGFYEALRAEWSRGARLGHPLAIILVDLDRFRAYNEEHGREHGDACLKAVAGVLADLARRTSDVVARCGGTKFGLILTGSVDEREATGLAEAIRARVEALEIPSPDDRPAGRVTASLGVAARVPDHQQPAERLVEAAESALIRAKEQGRNRVVRAGPS